MKPRTQISIMLSLMLATSGYAVNFTRDSGDSNWSNLDQWNDNSSGSYQNASSFPTSSDLILINAGKIISVDTNAVANIVVLPNATTDATLELLVDEVTLSANAVHVGNATQAGNGTVNQSAGTLFTTQVSLRPTETKTAVYNMSGGLLDCTTLEVGTSTSTATGTSSFVQSGGAVVPDNLTIGGAGPGTYEISGGSASVSGTFNLNAQGRLVVVGDDASFGISSLNPQAGAMLEFRLDETGVAPVQVSGSMDLANASILVDGSAYWGAATNFVLMDAGALATMAAGGNISITGLVSASVSQVGDTVVLSVVQSKTTAVFENTAGDGLWSTPGNWSPVGVPSGAVLALVGNGQTATIATTPPAVDGIIVGNNTTLVLQAALTTPELRFEEQGTLQHDLSMLGLPPVTLSGGVTMNSAVQLVVDGTEYEGFDGYFPLVLTGGLDGSITNHVTFTGFGAREPALVLQADGLWLRLIAPPALSQRLCSLVPDSTVATEYSNTQFSASRAFEPSGSAWSLSLSEGHVMDTRLSQEVIGAGSTVRSWDLRVARSGTIYSLRTPALGETVPPSYRSDGDSSPWNDEVWQNVAVDSALNDPANGSPYFIHQSGVYMKDPALKEPFYSPQVAAHLDVANRSFTTINWGQHAQIDIFTDADTNNNWQAQVLYFTRYRDLGQGVIEVSTGDYNYGPDTLDFLNMPWGGVRRTSTEYAFLADVGGTTWSAAQTNIFGPVTRKFNLSGGWMGFSATSNGVTPTLGQVYGRDAETLPPGQTLESLFRWGYAGGTFQTSETNWRNYFVTSCIRRYNLTQGSGIWSRYYFVLGDDMQDVSDRIAARNLVDVQLSEFNYTEATTPLVGYSHTGSGGGFQIVEDGRSPDFFLYAYPIPDSFPIYEIIENDETRHITWNPFATGVIKPYDGTIAGMHLLGFARRTADISGSAYSYESMETVMSGASANYLASGEALSVRTATPIETWRVEYFGFSDDVGGGANSANPDGDVANNFYEYGFGGNPTNGLDVGYLPESGTLAEGGTNFFEVVYARRIGSADELTYTMESSPNLLSNDWNTAEYTELPLTGTLDPDFEAVTNRIDTSGKTNEFIRLNVQAL